MVDGEYCILREETVREKRGSYSGFCCRLYPFICWIIIKEGPGNFSGGRSPHWVNHVNPCLLYCVSFVFCFCICFILLLCGPIFLTVITLIFEAFKHAILNFLLIIECLLEHYDFDLVSPW
jgi:hypothetical protein